MDDACEYKRILRRYRDRWTYLSTIPLVIAWCVETIAIAGGSWEEAVIVDVLTHALLFSPIWTWTLARRELRAAIIPPPAKPHAAIIIYRARRDPQEAVGPVWREMVLVTGAFPWRGLVIAGLYVLIDAVIFSRLGRPLGYLLGYLSLIVAPIFFVLGRGCAIYWWFVQLYRDASRVAVIEARKKEGQSEVVLRGIHDTWLGSVVGADPDTGKLRIEILGNVERWDLISLAGLATLQSAQRPPRGERGSG